MPLHVFVAGKMFASKLEKKKNLSLEWCCWAAKESLVPTKVFSLLEWAKAAYLQSVWRRLQNFQCTLSSQAVQFLSCLAWTSCSLYKSWSHVGSHLIEGACLRIDSDECQWCAWSCLCFCPLKRVRERDTVQAPAVIVAALGTEGWRGGCWGFAPNFIG